MLLNYVLKVILIVQISSSDMRAYSMEPTTVKTAPLAVASDPKIELFAIARRRTKGSRSGKAIFTAFFELPAGLKPKIQKGQKVQINLPIGLNQSKLEANVSKLNEKGFEVTFLYPSRTIEGMNIATTPSIANENLYLFPLNAVFSPLGDKQYVFIIEKGKAILHQIILLSIARDKVVGYFSKQFKLTKFEVIVSGLHKVMNKDYVKVMR